MDIREIFSTPALINLLGFDQYLVTCLYSFSIAISNSKGLGSGTSGSSVYISVCLASFTPCTLHVVAEINNSST